jgi:hypothetical protein
MDFFNYNYDCDIIVKMVVFDWMVFRIIFYKIFYLFGLLLYL